MKYWAQWVLGIVYTVGLVGFWLGRELGFPYLTPINLLLTSFFLIGLGNRFTWQFWAWLVTVAVGGWGAEAVGVNTGLLFGEYAYGEVLGPKLIGVPLILAANWFLVVYAVAGTIEGWKLPAIGFALVGGLITTLLDVAIEPVAIEYGFWNWFGEPVPFFNYACWFIFTVLFLLVFRLLKVRLKNPISGFVLILQFLFFSLLNLTSWIS
jgi:putative membrane protein